MASQVRVNPATGARSGGNREPRSLHAEGIDGAERRQREESNLIGIFAAAPPRAETSLALAGITSAAVQGRSALGLPTYIQTCVELLQ